MITSHPSFVEPSSPEILLWRYMDLSKFIALLHDRALYFARSDKLGDPFEGSLPKKNRETLQEALTTQLGSSQAEINLTALSETNKSFLTIMNISCWHMNEHESAAMWTLYSKSSDAICIQTTYKTLGSALPEEVMAGLVTYVDYEVDAFDGGNIFTNLCIKEYYMSMTENYERSLSQHFLQEAPLIYLRISCSPNTE